MELQLVWGWQPALYLFLGGMGAGTFIMAAVLYLIDPLKHKRIICASMWAAPVCVGVGLLLLLLELTNPLRGLMMWQSFSHFTSWMTYGAWGAFAAIVVFGLSALLATEPVRKALLKGSKGYAKKEQGLRKVLAVIGIALGAFVAVYTGMLLMCADGVPLWNSPFLPCLFTVSAFDTGVALVELISVICRKKESLAPKAHHLICLIVVTLVIGECLFLALFLGGALVGDTSTVQGATAASSAHNLVAGDLAIEFWVLLGVFGLLAPFAVACAGLVGSKKSESKKEDAKRDEKTLAMAVGATGALIGGCALRFLVLMAGVHADVITDAVLTTLL